MDVGQNEWAGEDAPANNERDFVRLMGDRLNGGAFTPLYARTVLERERQRTIDRLRDIDQALFGNRYKTVAKKLR